MKNKYFQKLNCFKAYDVRGRLGHELNGSIAFKIGCAIVVGLEAESVVIGFDARESSPELARELQRGAQQMGAQVFKIGLSGTEEMYWAVNEFNADVGVQVTASHNPIEYNGMKIVKSGSRPLSGNEFARIKNLAQTGLFNKRSQFGFVQERAYESKIAYINKILSFVDLTCLKPLKIIINSGNGASGPTFETLTNILNKRNVSTNFVHINGNPDSRFPNGIPNPLIEKNWAATGYPVSDLGADFGVAFDGDFDRCCFFDDTGAFIPVEQIIGLLSSIILYREKGASIVHDSRVVWNIMDVIKRSGGVSEISRTGHAFFKAKMREKQAIYGGEMSAHHYFRDFAYCDSGFIPFLLIWEFLSMSEIKISDILADRNKKFYSSGEINFRVSDPKLCFIEVKSKFLDQVVKFNEIDGLAMEFEQFRFNLRESDTEPLVRLNVESIDDINLLKEKTILISNLIRGF